MNEEAQILQQDGKPAFAVIPIKEYEAMLERLEDLEDLALLREAKREDSGAPGKPLSEVIAELSLDHPQ